MIDLHVIPHPDPQLPAVFARIDVNSLIRLILEVGSSRREKSREWGNIETDKSGTVKRREAAGK